MSISPLAEELLRTVLAYEDGLSDEKIRSIFGARYEQLAMPINELLKINRLKLFQQGDMLVYQAIKEETAAKFDGLAPEQIMVYQVIERAGNKGIWTRDIKVGTSIPQHTLTKTLKILEQRSLIKSVRSVVSKSKKLYMLFDMIPAKEISGGPWYSDQEFDHEFVNALSDFIVQLVKSKNFLTVNQVSDKIKDSQISKVELSFDEVDAVVNTLVFDGRLEEVDPYTLQMLNYPTGKKTLKVSTPLSIPDSLTATPCGVCPVYSQCSEGGVISPATCIYLTHWLDQPEEEGENEMSGDNRRKQTDLSW